MGLAALHGRTPPARKLGEVLPTVAMEGDTSAASAPRDADRVQGLRPGPLHERLLANLEEHSAAALALGTHDMHAL
jgi:hypothetical protein